MFDLENSCVESHSTAGYSPELVTRYWHVPTFFWKCSALSQSSPYYYTGSHNDYLYTLQLHILTDASSAFVVVQGPCFSA